jgi:F-type H+-transporting ATPase subunit gamma
VASLRDIRRRIKSVVSIKQITRAMEMVATTKLRRFQERAVASRPFTNEIEGVVKRLVKRSGEAYRPFILPPGTDAATAKKGILGILVVTSDRGLCGAYNANVFGTLVKYLRENELWRPGMPGTELAQKVRLYVIGRKGYTFLTRRGIEVERFFAEPPLEKMRYIDVRLVARVILDDFKADKLNRILVVSTRFESSVTFRAALTQWLPVSADTLTSQGPDNVKNDENGDDGDTILEPGADALTRALVPKFLERKLWNLLLESLTSEYASRRVSMKNATDAAEDMRGTLLRTYNRLRQESITKQLLEIVGGAEAIK